MRKGRQLQRLALLAVGGLAALGIACSVGPSSVSAATLFDRVCGRAGGGSGDSAACAESGTDKISGPNGLLNKITNIVALASGIVAVVFILFGGFKYITSDGDSGKLQEAKNTITYALVGLVVIVMARAIILFVLNKV